MTPEAQRIAIATHCLYCGGSYELVIPDYLNDLNAMHEAEETLTTTQLREYNCEIYRVLSRDYCIYEFHATAPQRAEAFLRTLNLWDNSK